VQLTRASKQKERRERGKEGKKGKKQIASKFRSYPPSKPAPGERDAVPLGIEHGEPA